MALKFKTQNNFCHGNSFKTYDFNDNFLKVYLTQSVVVTPYC